MKTETNKILLEIKLLSWKQTLSEELQDYKIKLKGYKVLSQGRLQDYKREEYKSLSERRRRKAITKSF